VRCDKRPHRSCADNERFHGHGRAYAGINNLFDRHYAGPVIVGDTNGRSFDPALGRNWFVRGSVDVRL